MRASRPVGWIGGLTVRRVADPAARAVASRMRNRQIPADELWVSEDATPGQIVAEAMKWGMVRVRSCSLRAKRWGDELGQRCAPCAPATTLPDRVALAERALVGDPLGVVAEDHVVARMLLQLLPRAHGGRLPPADAVMVREGVRGFIGGVHQDLEDRVLFPAWGDHPAVARAVRHAHEEHLTIVPLARAALRGGDPEHYVRETTDHFDEEDRDIYTVVVSDTAAVDSARAAVARWLFERGAARAGWHTAVRGVWQRARMDS